MSQSITISKICFQFTFAFLPLVSNATGLKTRSREMYLTGHSQADHIQLNNASIDQRNSLTAAKYIPQVHGCLRKTRSHSSSLQKQTVPGVGIVVWFDFVPSSNYQCS